MTANRIIAAALTAAAMTLIPTSAQATEGWNPDAVMVMPLAPEDMTPQDRELLEELHAEPGDVLPIVYEEQAYNGDTVDVVLFADTEIHVPPFSPLFAPAGKARADSADVYPQYGALLAWDDSDVRHDNRAYEDMPAPDVSTDGWTPELLVWVSDESLDQATFSDEVTWVRVGFGIQDVWVDSRNLTLPEESEAVAEFRADNLQEAADNAADEAEETEYAETSEPSAEPPEVVAPGNTALPAAPDDGGFGFPVPLVFVGIAGGALAAFLFRKRFIKPTAPVDTEETR